MHIDLVNVLLEEIRVFCISERKWKDRQSNIVWIVFDNECFPSSEVLPRLSFSFRNSKFPLFEGISKLFNDFMLLAFWVRDILDSMSPHESFSLYLDVSNESIFLNYSTGRIMIFRYPLCELDKEIMRVHMLKEFFVKRILFDDQFWNSFVDRPQDVYVFLFEKFDFPHNWWTSSSFDGHNWAYSLAFSSLNDCEIDLIFVEASVEVSAVDY